MLVEHPASDGERANADNEDSDTDQQPTQSPSQKVFF